VRFQRGFYITVAAIPLSLAVYKFTYSDDSKPYLQQMIEKYSDFKDEWNRRNALHTVMIEQAAHDRNLFQSEKVSTEVDLRFPEYVSRLPIRSTELWGIACLLTPVVECSIWGHRIMLLPDKGARI
jgi:hypothetical protein